MRGFPWQDTDTPRPTPRRPSGVRLEQLEQRETPAIFANNDFYSATAGQVLTVPANQGVLANDFDDIGAAIRVNTVPAPLVQFVGSNGAVLLTPLPRTPTVNPTLILNADGSFTFITPAAGQIPVGATAARFTYSATSTSGTATATVTISIATQQTHYIVAGADAGGGPHVRAYESGTGLLRLNFFPYESTFTGGVRVAAGDVNGDGVDDIITIPATGGAPRLRVYDGTDGAPLVDQFAFDPAFRGGGYVAVGDFNGDGRQDIIVGAGEGGGPRVQVFTYNQATATLSTVADFFAYDPSYNFGVRVAAGNLSGVRADATGLGAASSIVTAPGAGGPPEVRVFTGQQVISRPAAVAALDFFAGDATTADGLYVAVGNTAASTTVGGTTTGTTTAGTAAANIVTGTGSGAGIIRVYDGRNGSLLQTFNVPPDGTTAGSSSAVGSGTASGPLNFLPGQLNNSGTLLSGSLAPNSLVPATVGGDFPGTISGGARVATTDYDGDGVSEVVVGNGPGNLPRIRVFNLRTQTEITSILAYSANFLGGVNVGAH